MTRALLLAVLVSSACMHHSAPSPPLARGGGPPPAPAPSARGPTAEDARGVVARVRCAMAASCGDEGDGVDACQSRVRADLVGWPGCPEVDRRALQNCVSAIRDVACSFAIMPIMCAPESVCP